MIAKKANAALPLQEAPRLALPLSHVPRGERVRLLSCECGREMLMRLESMGIRLGVEIDVVMTSNRGPIVIGLGNSRFALGRAMTHKMIVAPAKKA